MTKPITCFAAMILYEEGRFQLNDPVANFIPEFKHMEVFIGNGDGDGTLVKAKREITIFDLMTHTAGLSYTSQMNNLAFTRIRQAADVAKPGSTLREHVEKLANLPLAHQPGELWRYSFSHDVLARLVEVISGQSFDTFLNQRVFNPLEMTSTGFFVAAEKAGLLATVYGPSNNGALKQVGSSTKKELLDPQRPPMGSTGLVSTPVDFLRFAQMMLNGGKYKGNQLLSPGSVALITMNHLSNELLDSFKVVGFADEWLTNGYGFGLGVRVLIDEAQSGAMGSKGEYSWPGTYNTFYWIDPEEELIALVWTQLDLLLHLYSIDHQFKAICYQALFA